MNEWQRVVIPFNPIPAERVRGGSRGFYNTSNYDDYLNNVAAFCRHHRLNFGAANVEIEAVFYRATKHRCDLDNLAKSLLDGLQRAGAFHDDTQVKRLVLEKEYDKENPRTDFSIRVKEDC